MSEEKIKELIEKMLNRTGPMLPLSAFKDFPDLPAPQTMRNKLSNGELPIEWFFKHDGRTMVDMDKYIPFWAKKFRPYKKTGQVAR